MNLTDYINDEMVQSYINFATQDGTVHDLGSYVLLYGPIAIALLLVVIGYQTAAMFATGAWRTARGAYRMTRTLVARPGAAGTGAGTGSEPAVVVLPAQPARRAAAKVG